MIEDISKIPLVDILSDLLNKRIVINDLNEYICLEDSIVVAISDIDAANVLQHQYYIDEVVLKINQWVGGVIVSGFTSNALGADHLYQSEIEDQLNLSGLASSGGDWVFKCSDDSGLTWQYLPHTNAQLISVVNAGIAHKLGALQQGEILKAQVRATTNQAEIDAITFPQV